MLPSSRATSDEIRRPLIGDGILSRADVVVDSAFTTGVGPEELWPWIVQLGKGRAGWYYPYWLERFLPKKWRGLRYTDPTLQHLQVGDAIGDWSRATMTVWAIQPSRHLVYNAVTPAGIRFSWALVLEPTSDGTRLHSRTRVAPVKRRRVWKILGGLSDRLLAAGLSRALRDRLADSRAR